MCKFWNSTCTVLALALKFEAINTIINEKKKVISILLTLTILSTTATSTFAQTKINDVVRTDFNYEKGSIEKLFVLYPILIL
ncbi:hypothetical protein [Clostridium boliviensis]|uniref:hypothetical protein n=1 Tax=Clostridium boliviensis TaxID=318465 RepID=UPI0029644372|nr:hypothetical protein [Clostridium boliviensis]